MNLPAVRLRRTGYQRIGERESKEILSAGGGLQGIIKLKTGTQMPFSPIQAPAFLGVGSSVEMVLWGSSVMSSTDPLKNAPFSTAMLFATMSP